MKLQSLKLSEIVTTAGTQIRAKIDAEAVSDYADAMIDGAKFPPVVVFHDGSEHILADGFHRVMAASRNGFKDILAEIHKGTKSDALKFALAANSAHGIKRTNADKRRSVELALAEWPKLSDRELSKICAVSNNFVSEIRRSQLSSDDSCEHQQSRIGADGKERKVPSKSINEAAQLPEPTEDGLIPCSAEEVKRTLDGEFLSAMGLEKPVTLGVDKHAGEPLVTEYYNRLEALVNDALENATEKQLNSMAVYAKVIPGLVRDELNQRKVRK